MSISLESAIGQTYSQSEQEKKLVAKHSWQIKLLHIGLREVVCSSFRENIPSSSLNTGAIVDSTERVPH